MSRIEGYEDRTPHSGSISVYSEPYVTPEVVDERPPAPDYRRHILLFFATCATTFLVGGPWYCLALMTILLCHEFGHYVQARRYHVPASLPYFIPMPLPPLGTMGAVITMHRRIPNRKALFDIGITGPLAGLVPAIICCVVGLQNASIARVPAGESVFGDPLLLKYLVYLRFGSLPAGYDVLLNPLLFAGWVGIFITGLNLIPIGQLDGGHVLYALLKQRAHLVATVILYAAIIGVVLTGNWGWSLMLLLLIFIGPKHPPTADDDAPLGPGRVVLGWITLAMMFVTFTPQPFKVAPPQPQTIPQRPRGWIVEAAPSPTYVAIQLTSSDGSSALTQAEGSAGPPTSYAAATSLGIRLSVPDFRSTNAHSVAAAANSA